MTAAKNIYYYLPDSTQALSNAAHSLRYVVNTTPVAFTFHGVFRVPNLA